MCEFNVIIDGKVHFRDVIYSKVDGEKIAVRNIMGEAKEFNGYKIVEIDVPNTRLVLSAIKE
jgi:predicted RNA-binding protein